MNKTRKLTTCAIMIALASVLSLIPIVKMPLGGTLTPLSMLPIVLLSILFGLKWGLSSAFLYSVIQLVFGITMDGVLGWGLTPLALCGTIFLDYIFAFTLLGFAGAFRQKGLLGNVLGIALVLVGRFACHFLSGGIIFDIWCEWSNAWLYSLCYNGAYMLPELVLTVIASVLLLRSDFAKKLLANGNS